MSLQTKQPGEQIRKLAKERHQSARLRYAFAAVVLMGTVLLFAETEVAKLLRSLEYRGWQLEYNLRIRRWGDADVVLHSPQGNWYVVDVKSHSGTKVYESGRLRKRYGRNTFDFNEGDLIGKVKGQATEVKHLKSARWVTALLCFTKGNVDIPRNEVSGIYIVNPTNLVNTLLHLDR
ncbi:hypothetical protein GS682_28510 [Nostoc sp. B(2019)]|nr:hypothetical protein [Nostoc sp. B(2019)]